MKVSINAAGREVTIECGDANVTYEGVSSQALAVWRATGDGDAPEGFTGPAYGFVAAERARNRPPSSAAWGPMEAPQ